MEVLKQENVELNKKSFTFQLMGNPVPLARPRFALRKDGRPVVYYMQEAYKVLARQQLILQYQRNALMGGPLGLDITFYMEIPRTVKRKIGSYHYIKPDLSNMIKFVEDVAIGIIYKDDCLIAQIISRKVYSLEPRTIFTVSEL